MDTKLYMRYLMQYIKEGMDNSDGSNAGISNYLQDKKISGLLVQHREEKNERLQMPSRPLANTAIGRFRSCFPNLELIIRSWWGVRNLFAYPANPYLFDDSPVIPKLRGCDGCALTLAVYRVHRVPPPVYLWHLGAMQDLF